jgi:hypothetical protein
LPGAYKVQLLNALDHLCDLNAHDFIIKPRTSFIFTTEDEVEDEEENKNDDLKEINNTVDSNKNTSCEDDREKGHQCVHLDRDIETVLPATRTEELLASANVQQRFLVNFFKQYLAAVMRYEDSRHRFKHASKPLPFHLVVNGLAGSGKSYIISIIEQMLTDFCISESAVRNRPRRKKGLLKMAHTGKAALNILGWTIHTALGMVQFVFVLYSKYSYYLHLAS